MQSQELPSVLDPTRSAARTMEVKDRLLLPFFKPPVTGHFPVVRVDLAVTFEPLVVLAGGQFGPLGCFVRFGRFLERTLHLIERHGNPLMDLCWLD